MRIHKLRDLLLIKNGKDHSVLSDGKIPVYGSGGIMRYANKSIYNDESILLPRKGTLSNIQYVNKPFWSVDTIYYTIVNKDLADPFFLFNYLKSLDLSNLNTGTGVPSMTFESYYNLEIKLPSISIQKQISAVLSSLDSKIELNNRINAELEQMAKTIYDYWFVQCDFPISAEYAASVDQPSLEGKPYKSSGGKMVWSDELKREVPEGWEVKSLGELFYISLGGTPSTKEKKYWEKGTIPWLNSGEIANFPIINSELKITEAAIKSSATELLPKGSVMLSITRHLRPSILGIDACANQSVVGIKEKGDIKCYFLYPYLQNEIPRLMAMRSGAQQPHINKEIVAESNILLPNVESQILKTYNMQVGVVYDLLIKNAKENQKLTELRDWLLPMLMNGQVKVVDVVDVVDDGVVGMAAEAVGEYKVGGE